MAAIASYHVAMTVDAPADSLDQRRAAELDAHADLEPGT
jgi:hypothetical protein